MKVFGGAVVFGRLRYTHLHRIFPGGLESRKHVVTRFLCLRTGLQDSLLKILLSLWWLFTWRRCATEKRTLTCLWSHLWDQDQSWRSDVQEIFESEDKDKIIKEIIDFHKVLSAEIHSKPSEGSLLLFADGLDDIQLKFLVHLCRKIPIRYEIRNLPEHLRSLADRASFWASLFWSYRSDMLFDQNTTYRLACRKSFVAGGKPAAYSTSCRRTRKVSQKAHHLVTVGTVKY